MGAAAFTAFAAGGKAWRSKSIVGSAFISAGFGCLSFRDGHFGSP